MRKQVAVLRVLGQFYGFLSAILCPSRVLVGIGAVANAFLNSGVSRPSKALDEPAPSKCGRVSLLPDQTPSSSQTQHDPDPHGLNANKHGSNERSLEAMVMPILLVERSRLRKLGERFLVKLLEAIAIWRP